MASSCILHRNEDATIILIDIPRSIELAQASPTTRQRLITSQPLERPYASVEPKTAKARGKIAKPSLGELLFEKHLQLALEYLQGQHRGPWCLSRHTSQTDEFDQDGSKRKRKSSTSPQDVTVVYSKTGEQALDIESQHPSSDIVHAPAPLYQNLSSGTRCAKFGSNQELRRIPPRSTAIIGDIHSTRDLFLLHAPKFDLIILDPPWPNRSARRSKYYDILYGTSDTRDLLSSIPIHDRLESGGLVAIWITNKPAFKEILLGEGGYFDEWGVGLIEEWVWLKVTKQGEPVCALDSAWRKPYEILLLGQRQLSPAPEHENGDRRRERIKRRVIFGVRDLHSRKPNLKELMEELTSLETREHGNYEALEIFARNMTVGWWSWGVEACKFQAEEYWTSSI